MILGILLAVALGYFSFRRPLKRSPIVFGMQAFCVTLAPAMAFVLLRGGILAERFLYAPALGFCIGVTGLILRWTNFPMKSGESIQPSLLMLAFVLPLAGALAFFITNAQ